MVVNDPFAYGSLREVGAWGLLGADLPAVIRGFERGGLREVGAGGLLGADLPVVCGFEGRGLPDADLFGPILLAPLSIDGLLGLQPTAASGAARS